MIQNDQHVHAESVHYLAVIVILNWYVLWRALVRVGPVLEVTTTYLAGLHSSKVLIPSKQHLQTHS